MTGIKLSPQQAPITRAVRVAVTNSTQTIFTVGANQTWNLRGFLIANTTGGDLNITVSIRDASATTYAIASLVTVPLRDTLEWDPGGGDFYLTTGDAIQVLGSAASGLVGHFSLQLVL